jgi:VanZ family protein
VSSSLPGRSPSRSRAGRLRLWLPVVIYAAAIFVVSSLPQPPAVGGVSDKWGHGAAYAGLALVILRALAGAQWSGVTRGRAVVALALAASYGASDEWHQAFVPGRSPDVHDLVADGIGAAAAVGAAWVFAVLREARKDRI